MKEFFVTVFALLLFLSFWCGLLVAISHYGGWSALARRYRFTGTFEGNRWFMQHAHFRWSCNYSGALTVGANGEGLYMSVLPLFNFGHAKLFIRGAKRSLK